MKRYVVSPGNYALGLGNPVGEVFTLPSLTIPGQSLSLQELLDRFVRGSDIPEFEGEFTEDPFLDNVERMDFDERAELRQQLSSVISETQARRSARTVVPPVVATHIDPEM